MKRNDSNIKNIPTLVTACCVLHDLCELHVMPVMKIGWCTTHGIPVQIQLLYQLQLLCPHLGSGRPSVITLRVINTIACKLYSQS